MSGIGAMRHYGILKQGTRQQEPGAGGTTVYATVWEGFGQLTADSSNKVLEADQTLLQQRKRWRMRWDPQIQPAQGWLLEHDGNVYAVTGVRDEQERERYWVLTIVQNNAG